MVIFQTYNLFKQGWVLPVWENLTYIMMKMPISLAVQFKGVSLLNKIVLSLIINRPGVAGAVL